MTSEVPGTSGQQSNDDVIQQGDIFYGGKGLLNISVQTGEEFSPEFLRDRVTPRKGGANDMDQRQQKRVGFNINNNQQLVYDDHSGPNEGRRMLSENSPDRSDFSPSKSPGREVVDKAYFDGLSRYHMDYSAIGQKSSTLSDESSHDRATESPTTLSVHKSNSPHSYQPFGYGAGVSDGGSFSGKMKFLCSFGGRILPRPNDAKLRYVGGETRIISIRKNVTYIELIRKTFAICNQPHTIKYQLPGEDLDALISVCSDEDLHLMIDEFHDLERSSQRLRIFLVPSNEPESPCDARTVQHSDADYQYVIAVNGMQDPSLRKSSSRDSLSSQASHLGGYLDNSPTFQRDSPTSFHPWEIRSGGSPVNMNLMLSNPNTQVFNTPQIANKSYIQPPFPAPIQLKVHKNSPMKVYEDRTTPDGYEGNSPYALQKSAFEKSYGADATAYNYNHPLEMVPVVNYHHQDKSLVESNHKNTPTRDLVPSSPLYGQGDMDAERSMLNKLAIHYENALPYQNAIGLFSESNLLPSHHKISYFPSDLEMQHEGRTNYSLEEGTASSLSNFETEKSPSDATSSLSQEWTMQQQEKIDPPTSKAPDASKAYSEWDNDMIKWMEKKDSSFGQDQDVVEGNDRIVLRTYDMEHKMNLANIQCNPNLRINVHNSARESQVPGCTNAPSPATVLDQAISSDIVSHGSPGQQLISREPIIEKPVNFTHFARVGSSVSSNLDEDDPIMTELSQLSPVSDAVLAKIASIYEDMVNDRQNSAKKEDSAIFVQSHPQDNSNESKMPELMLIVEDVTDSTPSDMPSSSAVVPLVQDGPSDGELESECMAVNSDCKVTFPCHSKILVIEYIQFFL